MANRANGAYDVIVIGAGHNGLTAAAFLAKSGRKVLVLEQRERSGGLCASEEYHGGYLGPGALHDTSSIRHNLLEPLDLQSYGLELQDRPPSIYAPQRGGKGLLLHHDPDRAAVEIAAFSRQDAERYREFRSLVDRVSGFVNGTLDEVPPDLSRAGARGRWPLLKKARTLRGLGKRDMMDLIRIGSMPVADWLGEWFKTDLLKALLAGPAIYGTFMGPRSPGSALNLLIWECRKGPLVRGGPAALVSALERAARAQGAEIRAECRVDRIHVSDGKVSGVSVNGGESIDASILAATCDPKQTILDLLPGRDITEKMERRMRSFRATGTAAKVNIAMNARIEMAGRPGEVVELVRTGESLDDLERAFDPVKYGRHSERPILDVYIPSARAESTSSRRSVLSILAHFVPYHLTDRWDYRAREALGERVVRTLAEFAPRLRDAVVATQVLTPQELEARYALTEGHVYHGHHGVDQLVVRPIPECARYATPIEGLYLCGSGSHPGGGITCAPGALGARRILSDT